MKKRTVSLFCALCLCLTLLPVTAGAVETTVPYIYYTWDNNALVEHTGTTTATVLDRSTTAWGGSESGKEYWYVVNSTFTIGGRVTVSGEVHLILGDNCTLAVNGGIQVAQGNSLTIYGQSGGTGWLNIWNCGDGSAGIGGNNGETAGAITIHSGRVSATGGRGGGAGIGGGAGGAGGTVTIYGGNVEATGGSGFVGNDRSGAGIGGGDRAAGGDVTIYGGTVTANGGANNIKSGGGAGIGGGADGAGGTFSTGQGGNAVIFASAGKGSNHIQDQTNYQNWQGVIFQGDSGQVYGSVTLNQSLTIVNGKNLTIPENSSLTVNGSCRVYSKTDVYNYGAVTVNGSISIALDSSTWTNKVTGITLPDSSLTVGGTAPLTAEVTRGTVTPFRLENEPLTWESNCQDVATVAADSGDSATVTAVKEGTATITAKAGDCVASCTVTVTPYIPVTGVSLNQNTLNLTVGGTAPLTATVQPSDATNQNVTWASGNSSVATVDSGGTVTAVGAGTATITVTTTDGGYIASCAVTVTAPYVPPVTPSTPVEDSDPSYSVALPGSVTGGTVTAKKSYAEEGEAFSFTVTPDAGWELASLSVTDGAGRAIPVTDEGGGEYSFEMPAGRISLDVTFREIGSALPFSDVSESYWARDEIAWAYENGYMSGVSATAFHPGGTVSCQQVWMILARMAGENPADMAAARAWAVESGISDGTNPGGAVTRQQLAAFLYRYAVQNGMAAVTMEENLSGYPDAANVSGYAVQALNWAVGQGILGGMADGTLNPGGTASRAQLAVMLCRWLA